MCSNTGAIIINDLEANLKKLISRSGDVSGSEISKKTGLPVSTVNKLISGNVSDPRISTLKPLANYFGVTVDQLLGYEELQIENICTPEPSNSSLNIPVFDMSNFSSTLAKPLRWFAWSIDTVNDKQGSFALLVPNNSFLPLFDKDTILIAEPRMLPPQEGDYLAIKSQNESITIKKYHCDGFNSYVIPLNPQLPATKLPSEELSILAVITEVHTKLRD